jgi:hypothetical protein
LSGVDFLKLTNKERQSPRYPLRTQHITIHKLLRRLHTVGTSTRDKKKPQQVVPLVLVRNHASPGQISDCMLCPVTACDYKNKNSREALLFCCRTPLTQLCLPQPVIWPSNLTGPQKWLLESVSDKRVTASSQGEHAAHPYSHGA